MIADLEDIERGGNVLVSSSMNIKGDVRQIGEPILSSILMSVKVLIKMITMTELVMMMTTIKLEHQMMIIQIMSEVMMELI